MNYTDKNIVNQSIALFHVETTNEFTNVIGILSRPKLVADESGDNPGELFNEVFFTREEVMEILRILDDDWASQTKCGTYYE